MDINTAKRLLDNARDAVKAGSAIEAARLALAALTTARQCRAAARHDVAFYGHCIAAYWAAKVLAKETDPAIRSEAGRIKADARRIGF